MGQFVQGWHSQLRTNLMDGPLYLDQILAEVRIVLM